MYPDEEQLDTWLFMVKSKKKLITKSNNRTKNIRGRIEYNKVNTTMNRYVFDRNSTQYNTIPGGNSTLILVR